MSRPTVLILGAGPAGLTAAYELLATTDALPVILEASDQVGGLARTVRYHGNRIDIGGHRFFSKSATIMRWWQNLLPLQGAPARDERAWGQGVFPAQEAWQHPLRAAAIAMPAPDPEHTDDVMLIRHRLSRILFERRFYNYPITLDRTTLANLGIRRLCRIAASYLQARCHPLVPATSLEDFFINQFGHELYATFFRDYTEKVWGVPCQVIPADWGAQRVRGLSLARVLGHALRPSRPSSDTITQRNTATSLIDTFLYPKYGPGQLWETVAAQIQQHGGRLHLGARVVGLQVEQARVVGVEVATREGRQRMHGDYVLSSLPLRDLIAGMPAAVPDAVRAVAAGLVYRDFITVGILARRLRPSTAPSPPTPHGGLPDNWIYIQEPDVQVARLQLFHNWSPYLVADPATAWVGMEYFCTVGDALWARTDQDMAALAVREMAALGLVDPCDVLDTVVIRVPDAYPAYFGAYAQLPVLREYLDRVENLFLIGRNGMHRYNNMDHSMLTAMAAVRAIREGSTEKAPLWAVNADEDYHEQAT